MAQNFNKSSVRHVDHGSVLLSAKSIEVVELELAETTELVEGLVLGRDPATLRFVPYTPASGLRPGAILLLVSSPVSVAAGRYQVEVLLSGVVNANRVVVLGQGAADVDVLD